MFKSYWWFAQERQDVFHRRLLGAPPPWSKDPVIANHKFTNAFRASDRESQFLIREVVGTQSRSPADTFFRILLFRLFNRASTWQLLNRVLGELSIDEFDINRFDAALTTAMEAKVTLFSAAYIMPSRGEGLRAPRKHTNLLLVLQRMLDDELPERIFDTHAGNAFRMLRSYPMIGDFLAYQYLTDLGYSELAAFKEDEFVIPGPGARDGLRKCFADNNGWADADIIRWVHDNQEVLAEQAGYRAPTLFGRRLQLIDCQNLFCEVDKYARVAHPTVEGHSGRTRIKQKYDASPLRGLPRPTYPKNWLLNDAIKAFYGGRDELRGLPETGPYDIAVVGHPRHGRSDRAARPRGGVRVLVDGVQEEAP